MTDRRLGVSVRQRRSLAPSRSPPPARPLSLSRGGYRGDGGGLVSAAAGQFGSQVCATVMECLSARRTRRIPDAGRGGQTAALDWLEGRKGRLSGRPRPGSPRFRPAVDKPAAGIPSAETSAEILQWFAFKCMEETISCSSEPGRYCLVSDILFLLISDYSPLFLLSLFGLLQVFFLYVVSLIRFFTC